MVYKRLKLYFGVTPALIGSALIFWYHACQSGAVFVCGGDRIVLCVCAGKKNRGSFPWQFLGILRQILWWSWRTETGWLEFSFYPTVNGILFTVVMAVAGIAVVSLFTGENNSLHKKRHFITYPGEEKLMSWSYKIKYIVWSEEKCRKLRICDDEISLRVYLKKSDRKMYPGFTGPGSYYTSTFEGYGGLSKVYLTNAFMLGKNLSVGVNVSYIFGNTKLTESQSSISVENRMYTHAFYADFGLQYHRQIGKRDGFYNRGRLRI